MLLNTVGKQERVINSTKPGRGQDTFELHTEEHTGVRQEKMRALSVEATGGTMAELKRPHSGFRFAGKSSILLLLHKLHVESKYTSSVSYRKWKDHGT